jgi:hypothetical protein
VKRLSEALNKPKVALVVGVVAVAVNGLLYFGYYLPRMTPLIEQIRSLIKPFPEVVSKSLPEALNKAPLSDLPRRPLDGFSAAASAVTRACSAAVLISHGFFSHPLLFAQVRGSMEFSEVQHVQGR